MYGRIAWSQIPLRWMASLLLCNFASSEEGLEKLPIRVLDVSGGTVAGARVRLACDSGVKTQYEAYSDSEGVAVFTLSPPITCTATVQADKFGVHAQQLELKKNATPAEIRLYPLQAKTEIVVAAGPGAVETTSIAAAAT